MTAIVYSFFHSPLSVNIWWDDTLKKLLWFIYMGVNMLNILKACLQHENIFLTG